MTAKPIRAGAATANITPPLGTSLAGGMTDRIAMHVHDELHVRSLVLDNGDERIAMAVCDLPCCKEVFCDRAKHIISAHCRMPIFHTLAACTHTHSAPTGSGVFQTEVDPAFMDFVVGRMADCVRCAMNRLEPARVGWGVGREERSGFNRRYRMKPGTVPPNPFGERDETVLTNPGFENPNVVEPAGPTDPDVGLLGVVALAGRPIAALANYALHYVGGVPPGDVSADYFAAWANSMGRRLDVSNAGTDRPFVGILANGCCGDINNVDVRRRPPPRRPYEQIEHVADMLAAETFRVWRELEWHDRVELAVREKPIQLGVRRPTVAELDRAKELLARAPAQLAQRDQIYARETLLMADWPERITTLLHAFRIGDLAIVGLPGEPFCELGLQIKRDSPRRPTFVIGLANDYVGYVPTEQAHREGGYETWRARSSFLAPDAGRSMVQTVRELLHDL